jgi:hypothetical protein
VFVGKQANTVRKGLKMSQTILRRPKLKSTWVNDSVSETGDHSLETADYVLHQRFFFSSLKRHHPDAAEHLKKLVASCCDSHKKRKIEFGLESIEGRQVSEMFSDEGGQVIVSLYEAVGIQIEFSLNGCVQITAKQAR